MRNISEAVEKKHGKHPEKILQFGEGNFLRAFADWMIDLANTGGLYAGSIVLCQPISRGMAETVTRQNGLYTLLMRGRENGKEREETTVISSVSRCINPYEDYEALLAIARSPELEVVISNTTEAGIAYQQGVALEDRPPASYPGKLTAFLYERFKTFGGGAESGLLILPVELIDDNGKALRAIVLRHAGEWGLPEAFIRWLERYVCFASTLVDRIVTGYPREEIRSIEEKLGYTDDLLVTSELFNLWVIEADKRWAGLLPIHKTAANVIWTDNAAPYKKRKVRILNGGHTAMVLGAYLAGHETVLDCMRDDTFKGYLRSLLFDEVIPTLDLPRDELEQFAESVIDRFENPFIRHRLLDIALNSRSKFAARCLPSLLQYRELRGVLPPLLTFSLAAFLLFYKGRMRDGEYRGERFDGTGYVIRDEAAVLEFFDAVWNGPDAADPEAVAAAVLKNKDFWNGRDLAAVPGLVADVAGNLRRLQQHRDVRRCMRDLL